MKFPWLIPLGAVAGFTLTWAFFGYVASDWNMWNWHWFTRLVQAGVGIFFGAVIGFVFEVSR